MLPKVNSSNGFILLKMMDINFRRIGNLMWCYASLIGIARTNDFEPRVEAPAYRELKVLAHPGARRDEEWQAQSGKWEAVVETQSGERPLRPPSATCNATQNA